MAYAGVEEAKLYLGIGSTTTTDDNLLRDLLERASKRIDDYTGRVFEASTETRYFDSDAYDANSKLLWVDKDLLTITTLTNGDDDGTTIPSTEYWLWPRNETPYYAIRLKADSSYTWEWDTDGWVSVLGTWGFSTTPPDDIVHATIRFVAYYYHQKDSGIYETQSFPEAGVVVVPSGMPTDVKDVLDHYKRYV